MPLLLGETLVGCDQNREAVPAGLGEQFGVTQGAPLVVNGALDWRAIEGRLESEAHPRRDSDVDQDLQARRSSGEVGAGGVLRRSRPDGRASNPKDGGGGSGVDLEVPDELIQRHAVGKPVE